jgi:hypothetical protein
MTKAEIKDLAPIPAVVIICLNPREARVEVLGMTMPRRKAGYTNRGSARVGRIVEDVAPAGPGSPASPDFGLLG